MEDFYMNNTSPNMNYDYSNYTFFSSIYSDSVYCREIHTVEYLVTWTIACIGLPLTLVAIYSLYSLVQNDHVTPIYVINLLISDLIQLCYIIIELTPPRDRTLYVAVRHIYFCGLTSRIDFMVCVAMERYLVVAWPLWYRCRRTIRSSVVVCVAVWALVPLCFLIIPWWMPFLFAAPFAVVFFLLPLPLFIFFLVGTLRALSASQVPSDEKRRVVGCLVLVMLIYTLLFLPTIILLLRREGTEILASLYFTFLKLSPLADLGLYVFMRKGAIDKLLASVCRCKMDSDEMSSSQNE